MFILKLQNKYIKTFLICNEMYRNNEYINTYTYSKQQSSGGFITSYMFIL